MMKTDANIQQDVLAELKWAPEVNADHIGVAVNNGIVTLTGHVGSFSEKWHAEEAAQRVSGVQALAIEMDVNLPGFSKRTDADIAASAKTALEWISKASVKVIVENGWVSLSGEVDWEYQRQVAASAVRYLIGVTGFSNQIIISPKVASSAVKADIEAALKRRATVDAQTIKVDIKGSDVTLSGTVHSWSERELASQTAWSSPGVRNVVDNITIAS